MQQLENFIKHNIFCSDELESTFTEESCAPFRIGIQSTNILIDFQPSNELENIRHNYLMNLSLSTPSPISIPDNIKGLERAVIQLSSLDFENISYAGFKMQFELTGVDLDDDSKNKQRMMVKCYNTHNKEKFPFFIDGKSLKNCLIEPLTAKEQAILLIELIKVYKTEVSADLRDLKVKAFIDRILFDKNDQVEPIIRVATYYESLITGNYDKLEQLVNKDKLEESGMNVIVSHGFEEELSLFETPLVFSCDILTQLAEAYYSAGLYEKASEIFKRYNSIIPLMNCYIKMGKIEDAVEVGVGEANKLYNTTDRRLRIRVCNIYTLLGTLLDDDDFFDKAFIYYCRRIS